ncbi:hypothetical protein AQUCO_00400136v1 [Aquilegia coerulea]|uniref:Uncharacterized protein n=1 Tax=Aquilegia coerulea TaxID=218851 RepID=A0A2G5ETJ1_AQUCA|nr:hypothetical protein AQUCO_00400136v1 [Aquilegia coerulea]
MHSCVAPYHNIILPFSLARLQPPNKAAPKQIWFFLHPISRKIKTTSSSSVLLSSSILSSSSSSSSKFDILLTRCDFFFTPSHRFFTISISLISTSIP